MQVAVLGASGRTGRHVVDELLGRGHEVSVLVRDPGRVHARANQVRVVIGDSRDRAALGDLVDDCDGVISALGPDKGDSTVLRETAASLVLAMAAAEVRRFVGVSGVSLALPGDRKSLRDRFLAFLVRRIGGAVIADKSAEYRVYAASDLDFTLVRPIRLTDGDATGRVEHHADASPKNTRLTRADLAAFVVDVLEQHLYPKAAPLVANAPDDHADE